MLVGREGRGFGPLAVFSFSFSFFFFFSFPFRVSLLVDIVFSMGCVDEHGHVASRHSKVNHIVA